MRSSVFVLAAVAALAVTASPGLAQEAEPDPVLDEQIQSEAAPATEPAVSLEPLPPPPTGPQLPPDATKPQINAAHADIVATRGNRASGRLVLSPDNLGLRITGTLSGLSNDGVHGFHVHEVGDCSSADASSAGAHFDPSGQPHGSPARDEHHAGDLPNIQADSRGTAVIDMHLTSLSLGDEGERDVLGRAIVVHAQADDYRSQPAGDSGVRIGCGVIEATPAPALATPVAPEAENGGE